MYKIIAKQRKSKEIKLMGKIYTELIFAEVALEAFRAGAGSRFIRNKFTFMKIVQV